MRIYPPEHRIAPCLHGLHAQGFDNIIISTDIEPFYHVILPVECRNEDDWNEQNSKWGYSLNRIMKYIEQGYVEINYKRYYFSKDKTTFSVQWWHY